MSPLHLVHVVIFFIILWSEVATVTLRIAKKCTNEWMGSVSVACAAGTMLEVTSTVHYSDDIGDRTWPAVSTQSCSRSPRCLIFFSIFWVPERNTWIRCYRVTYRCRPVECPRPVAPPFGSVMVTSTLLNAEIKYSCDEGYTLLGSAKSTCVFNGKYYKWDAETPSCEIAFDKCPNMSSLAHPMGAHESLCYEFVLEEKKWSDANADCMSRRGTLVTVDSLDFLKTAFLTKPSLPQDETWRYFWTGGSGSCRVLVVNVRSPYNHHHITQEDCNLKNSYICQYEPKLPKKCAALMAPPMGEISSGNDSIGAEVDFRCGEGYRLTGQRSRKCLVSGLWSGENPTCTIVDCGEPDTMNENIEIKFNQTTYLSSADYNCKPGYEIIGSSVRLCSFNGNWTGADPYCQLITTPSSSTTNTPKIKTTNHPSTTVTIKSSIQDTTDEDLTKHLDGMGIIISSSVDKKERQESHISYKSSHHAAGETGALTEDGERGGASAGLVIPVILTVSLLIAVIIFILILIIRRNRRLKQIKLNSSDGSKVSFSQPSNSPPYISLATECLDTSVCTGSTSGSALLTDNAA